MSTLPNKPMNLLTPNLTLHHAEELLKTQSVYMLSEIGETCLHIQNNPETVHFLLENGAEPNWKTCMGNSPLHYKKSPEVVKLLLKYGADPNAKNSYGNTPLHKQTDKESIEILLNVGANKNIKNEKGKIPRDVNKNIPRSFPLYMFFILILVLLILIYTFVKSSF